jgi:6-phosphogluconate dehydrogenase (decarboxylating)
MSRAMSGSLHGRCNAANFCPVREADFANRVLSAMRHDFGGHLEKAATPDGGPEI